MKIPNFLQTILTYIPKEDYLFNLSENSTQPKLSPETNEISKEKNIFPSLSVNLEYVKTQYNTLINSDIIIREFTLNARGKQYSAFILYIDGMIDSKVMNDFILEPLMLRNKSNLFDGDQNRVISESITNNITVRKVKKFDLADYLTNCLLPQNSVEQVTEFDKAFTGVNSGNCALFVDTLNIAFDIEVKGFKQRDVKR